MSLGITARHRTSWRIPNSYNATKPSISLTKNMHRPLSTIELFHQPTSMHNFRYSLTICLLHYYPRHVSSINVPIFRRKNCIHTAFGIFALCKRLHSPLSTSVLCRRLTNILLMNKENCALKLVDKIILYYDARSKKHHIAIVFYCTVRHFPAV